MPRSKVLRNGEDQSSSWGPSPHLHGAQLQCGRPNRSATDGQRRRPPPSSHAVRWLQESEIWRIGFSSASYQTASAARRCQRGGSRTSALLRAGGPRLHDVAFQPRAAARCVERGQKRSMVCSAARIPEHMAQLACSSVRGGPRAGAEWRRHRGERVRFMRDTAAISPTEARRVRAAPPFETLHRGDGREQEREPGRRRERDGRAGQRDRSGSCSL